MSNSAAIQDCVQTLRNLAAETKTARARLRTLLEAEHPWRVGDRVRQAEPTTQRMRPTGPKEFVLTRVVLYNDGTFYGEPELRWHGRQLRKDGTPYTMESELYNTREYEKIT